MTQFDQIGAKEWFVINDVQVNYAIIIINPETKEQVLTYKYSVLVHLIMDCRSHTRTEEN